MSDDSDRWFGGDDRAARRTGRTFERRGRHRCPRCRGEGKVPGMIKIRGVGMGSAWGACPECDGAGWLAARDDTALDEAAAGNEEAVD